MIKITKNQGQNQGSRPSAPNQERVYHMRVPSTQTKNSKGQHMKPRKIIAAIAVASVLMSACTPQTATTPATASFQTASGESSSASIKKEAIVQKANATKDGASKDDKPTAGPSATTG